MTKSTYITQDGDQWDSIAKKVYGDELNADWLMENNGKYIGTFEFGAGVVLKTPPLPEARENNMPPWRR